MVFLPIVERELRVASRKRSTFWVRIIAALVAMVIGAAFLALTLIGFPGLSGAQLGTGLFHTLTWISLGVALTAGLFFTSDALSEEKREGTMGFLFLTDLKGYDVVLGKLLATSLRGSFALLAVFPILAITFPMGGIAAAQFWKTLLALVNALFVSLVAGLFVSCLSRDSQKALGATLLLLLLLTAGTAGIDAGLAALKGWRFTPKWSLSSPLYLFLSANLGWPLFWPALLINQVVGWTLLAASSVLLPRTWEDRGVEGSRAPSARRYRWKYGGTRRRVALRRKLIGRNPVLWLACRDRRWNSLALWIFTALMLAGFIAALVAGVRRSGSGWQLGWYYVAQAMMLVLYLAAASEVGRFFVAAKRSGLLELLLTTPLAPGQIVAGQIRALLRKFGPQLALWLLMLLIGGVLAQHLTYRSIARATTPPASPPTATTNSPASTGAPSATNTAAVSGKSAPGTLYQSGPVSVRVSTGAPGASVLAPGILAWFHGVTGTLIVAANLVALCWFGMWMGLTSKSANMATLKTLLFVQVLPWFAISFASAILTSLLMIPLVFRGNRGTSPGFLLWYTFFSMGVAVTLYLTKDIILWLWARRKLRSELRERAGYYDAPIRRARPPALPETVKPGEPPPLSTKHI